MAAAALRYGASAATPASPSELKLSLSVVSGAPPPPLRRSSAAASGAAPPTPRAARSRSSEVQSSGSVHAAASDRSRSPAPHRRPPPVALSEGGSDVLLAALAGDLGGEAAGERPRRGRVRLGGVGAVAEEELDERGVAADGSVMERREPFSVGGACVDAGVQQGARGVGAPGPPHLCGNVQRRSLLRRRHGIDRRARLDEHGDERRVAVARRLVERVPAAVGACVRVGARRE